MGLFSRHDAPEPIVPLNPVPRAIGVLPHFAQHNQQMTLKVREKKASFSGDDFACTDATTNQTVLKVDGHAWTMHGTKDIYDAHGTKLFVLRKKLLSMHFTYEGRDPSSEEVLFTVKSSFSFGTKLHVNFKNRASGQGENVELTLKGDWFDRKAEITTSDGIPVARIGRSFVNVGQLFFDQQTYFLSCAAGVDISLLLAIAVCLDEKSNEEKHG
ncbi:hypothetical protein IE81DRAFT_320361 [Ceraceosorus guamensis]|uniref:DUF567-domain-containing protein n=1 Tax=Ceraceosorus guamensis TaxID=1522189 RepID=A0A316W5Q2_9BASI|nr:hypothetical protein IE81DRAFT_320361 [Ceraceosorus guamensis]PWN45189.1 hypothetical protein IE81DRAFT_320361 [Ceraceosorus guamensis]